MNNRTLDYIGYLLAILLFIFGFKLSGGTPKLPQGVITWPVGIFILFSNYIHRYVQVFALLVGIVVCVPFILDILNISF